MSVRTRSSVFLVTILLASIGCDEQASRLPAAPASPDAPAELAAIESDALDHLLAESGPAGSKGIVSVRVLRNEVDDLGVSHTRVQQLYRGVPVFGGEAIVHLDPDGRLSAMTDNLVPDIDVDPNPNYSAEEAADLAALGWYREPGALTAAPEVELVILRRDGLDHLVYKVQLERIDDEVAERPLLFIDAHTGEVVWDFDNLQSAAATCTGATNYYGTVSFDCLYTTYGSSSYYFTEDASGAIGTFSRHNTTSGVYYVLSSSPNFATSSAVDRNAVEAHYVMGLINDWWMDTLGRDGVDGSGGPTAFTTHGTDYLTTYTSHSTKYVNAYWNGSSITFGDGDGTTSGSLTMLDVAGHEFAHGVTEYTAGLTYSGESGGLNESMSDVFGAMVERAAFGDSADVWLMGEDGWTPSTAGDALRYMDDPAADGRSYDYYSSGIGSADVHYSSGVPNLAFYLLCEGGTHPRGDSDVLVTGIGADAATEIWYRALSSYMTSSSDMADARQATLDAAEALFGIDSDEYTQVGNAWAAVGVGGLALEANFRDYGGVYGPGTASRTDGVVTLSGSVVNELGAWESGDVIATLSEDMRPDARIILNVNQHEDTGRLDVSPSGAVTWIAGETPYTWVSLDGASFEVDKGTTLPLASGMTAYGAGYRTPSYSVHGDRVKLSGLVRSTDSDWVSGDVIATLPAAAWPDARLIFNLNQHEYTARVDVLTDGRVVWIAGDTPWPWLSLDGVDFQVDKGTSLTLKTGFSSYGAGYRTPSASADGHLVQLSGLVRKSSSTWTSGTVIASLPAGQRPNDRLAFNVNQHDETARVDVDTNGDVVWRAGLTSYPWVSLDGISFLVE